MHIKKIFIACCMLSIFLFSCKKDQQANSVPGSGPGACVESGKPQDGDIISGKYIVAYNDQAFKARGMSVTQLRETGESVLERNDIPVTRMEQTFGGAPGGFVASLSPEEVTRLQQDATIGVIEPDRIIALSLCFTVAEPRLLTWNIQRVGYGNGIGKTAWIIDTGIDFDHPDLTVDVTRSRSFISGVSSADDENGHGTHVAGIIGGKNNSIGVLGVASGATLISLRVLNGEGTGMLSSIIEALSYVNENAKAGDVVNMSLGDEGTSTILVQAVQNTAARGIYIAIAAGNEHQLANKTSPANANGPNIYTVSAIDSLDHFASFSNYGNDVVDYAVPGVRILSTFSDGRYAYLSGTSMAAPHMAGLLLLKGAAISTSGYAVNDPDGVADPIAHK
jgi:hypothetical protein